MHSFARRVFLIAGIYGLVALTPQYFLEGRIGRDAPPPITHPEYFYGFLGIAIAWQLCFLAIARDPVRLRPVMLPAVVEKLAFGIPAIGLYAQDRLSVAAAGFGALDLVLAGLFAAAYRRTGAARGADVRSTRGGQPRAAGVTPRGVGRAPTNTEPAGAASRVSTAPSGSDRLSASGRRSDA